MDTSSEHHRRRTDRGWRSWREPLRDLWTIALTGLVFFALLAAHKADERQDEGRRVGSAITCGVTSAVIDAGRSIVTGGATVLPPRFARNLERLGMFKFVTRKRNASAAASTYGTQISEAVRREVVKVNPRLAHRPELAGPPTRQRSRQPRGRLVRMDGTLDCALLRRLSGLPR